MVLLPTMNVDGFFVKENQRAREIHFSNNTRRASNVDDDEIVAGDRAQANGVGGISFVRPVIMIARKVQEAGLGKARAKVRNVDFAKSLAGRDRQFERSAFQMIDKNLEIVRLDESMLGRIAEKIVRVPYDKLI